jgi:hypothetical protein
VLDFTCFWYRVAARTSPCVGACVGVCACAGAAAEASPPTIMAAAAVSAAARPRNALPRTDVDDMFFLSFWAPPGVMCLPTFTSVFTLSISLYPVGVSAPMGCLHEARFLCARGRTRANGMRDQRDCRVGVYLRFHTSNGMGTG